MMSLLGNRRAIDQTKAVELAKAVCQNQGIYWPTDVGVLCCLTTAKFFVFSGFAGRPGLSVYVNRRSGAASIENR